MAPFCIRPIPSTTHTVGYRRLAQFDHMNARFFNLTAFSTSIGPASGFPLTTSPGHRCPAVPACARLERIKPSRVSSLARREFPFTTYKADLADPFSDGVFTVCTTASAARMQYGVCRLNKCATAILVPDRSPPLEMQLDQRWRGVLNRSRAPEASRDTKRRSPAYRRSEVARHALR